MEVELLVSNNTQLGEGPVWDHRKNLLYWVDIQKGHVQAYDYLTGKNTIHAMGEYVGAAVPTKDGRLVVALQNRIGLFDPDTEHLEILCDPEPGNMVNRFNDGKCDPAGRFWIGSTQINHKDPTGVLYCIDSSGSYQPKIDHLLISNGLAWSSDHSRMYFIDSPTNQVREFEYNMETAEIQYRRVALEFDPGQGVPDGMCIDAEDMLWVAFYGGGRVGRYNPASGDLLREIRVPARNTTSCCFGGPDMNMLFITTARRDDPQGGGLYCCRAEMTGPLANFFGSED